MHHFAHRDGVLHAEDVPLPTIAETVGTPVYVYAAATLRRHFTVVRDGFGDLDPLIAYSVKANSNVAVIALLARMGAGADVVSAGELRRALAAGVAPADIVFSGVGKTDAELAAALEVGIGLFNVESESELDRLSTLAAARGQSAPVALRLNPDVTAGGHDKISTGRAQDKFGLPWDRGRALYLEAQAMPGVRMCGLDVHVGSQITDLGPFLAVAERLAALTADLRGHGAQVDVIDIGGGLGIPYDPLQPAPPDPETYAKAIAPILKPLDVKLIIEPGRMIAGNAGLLMARVVHVKTGVDRDFVIADAGMNDLMRPTLYGAWHDVHPVIAPGPECERTPVDVVGPVCESGDVFASARPMPRVERGDLISFFSAGAYGASLASEYNSRPLVPEVLVDGAKWDVIRPRPSLDDLIARDHIPQWMTQP